MAGINTQRPVWYHFKDGMIICKKGKEETEFNAMRGKIIAFRVLDEIFEGDTYKKLQVNLNDGQELSILQMRLNSGYGRSFALTALNIDYTKEVVISGQVKEVNGKSRSRVFIKQWDKYVKQFFTKEEPKDLPPVLVTKLKSGKTVYDSGDQEKFFIKMFSDINKILNMPATPSPEGPKLDQDPNSDLPF